MMKRRVRGSAVLVNVAALWLAACATATGPATGPAPTAAPAKPPPRPAAYESEDISVTFAQPGDTPETLAARFLGGADKAWMIEDYTGLRAFAPGQEVVIPRRPWNPTGVTPGGYQIVPILTYHNLAEQAKGRLVLAAASFREQMGYLKANGYRVVSLADFVEFTRLNRQLPQRAVVLTSTTAIGRSRTSPIRSSRAGLHRHPLHLHGLGGRGPRLAFVARSARARRRRHRRPGP
jgi:hypothetical protein